MTDTSRGSNAPERGASPIIDCHVHLNNYHEETRVSLDLSLDLERAIDGAT